MTVEKVKTPTPKPVTPQPVTKVASVLPTTGSSTGDMLAYGGMVILLATLGGTVYYMRKKKTAKE
ncbi:LPXTG cell wall anchor domain-containing protein [Lactococcus protaetiae]|uniref:LPXTG cell wall anchor domain-containing protein n=1 Tax=Lactococcus protaetiae TaxID=2592653 RepID=UPI001CC1E1AE|nr:LPXTG cell wall anchor domain-containing protein [Lactococcus protaetiae]